MIKNATAQPFTATLTRDSARLAALAGEWQAIEGRAPFCSWRWLESWWRHYQHPAAELFVVEVRNQEHELVGLAPCYLSRSLSSGRIVRFLGSGEVCSDYTSLLAKPGLERQVADSVADWLVNEGSGRWDLLELGGFEAADPAISRLCEKLESSGEFVTRYPDLSCWRVNLPGDWETYLGTLSKSRRERTRSLLRRNFEIGAAVLRVATTTADLERGFEILVDLHQRRRQSLGQPGCFASKRFTNFHREVSRRFFESGQLRLMWTELSGLPISAEYGLVSGDTVYYYQGGFDPDFAEQRPGWLALASSLKLAIEQGYRHYDFLRGVESYKASWRAEPRPMGQVRVFARHSRGRLRHATFCAGQRTKLWARQGLQLARGLTSFAKTSTSGKPAGPSQAHG